MTTALDAHPAAAWDAPCREHPLIRIRALTAQELREAQAAAAESAPPDLYGQMMHGRLLMQCAQRLDDLRRISIEAAKIADVATVAGDPTAALEALQIARRSLEALKEEHTSGRPRAMALLAEEDPLAHKALGRFHRYMTEPHRQVAARALVAWPGVLSPGFTVADALAALGPTADDPIGYTGAGVAEEIVGHLTGRALGERGKEHSAPPSSSRGAGKTAIRFSPKRHGIAPTVSAPGS